MTTQHIGTIGDRIDVTGTVTHAAVTQHSRFERRLLVVLDTPAGVVKTFVKLATDLGVAKVGETWTVTGKVKAHEWRGKVAQTLLVQARGWDPNTFFDMPTAEQDAADLAALAADDDGEGNTRCRHCHRMFDAGASMLTECGFFDCPGVAGSEPFREAAS